MNGKLGINRALFQFARRRGVTINSAPRWRNVLIALLVALSMGGANLPQVAGPQTFGERFFMGVDSSKNTLCTGERGFFVAHVYYQTSGNKDILSPEQMRNLPKQSVSGVKIEAYAEPASLGTFLNSTKAGIVSQITGFDLVAPFSVEFDFTAGKKPGAGTLVFQGAVEGYDIHVGYVSSNVPVKVVACKYQVQMTGMYHYSSAGGSSTIVAVMKKTTITRDENGNFTGTGAVTWIGSQDSSYCGFSVSISSSKAILTGSADDSGDLKVTVALSPAVSTATGSCGGGSSSLVVDPYNFWFPVEGGPVTGPSRASTSCCSFTGKLYVVVRPENH